MNWRWYKISQGPGVAQWLRRCATSRTVPGSIPGGVTGFFSDIFPSDRTMTLGSTHPLVKMSTRNIPGGKGGRCVRLTTSPPSCAECHENLRASTSWNPLGHTRPVTGLLYLYLLQDIAIYINVLIKYSARQIQQNHKTGLRLACLQAEI